MALGEYEDTIDTTLTHRERNTVQLTASQGKESGLNMRDMQGCVNPCNA
jgi:hypothetical protein